MAHDDKELVLRCQSDPTAFEELMRRYRRAIYAYAVRSVGSRQDAEEITQDTFVKVFRAAHRFNSHYSFTTWLYTIASNTCKNKLRSRSRHKAMSLDNEKSPFDPTTEEPGPLEAYRRKIEIEEVRAAINDLPTRYKQVLHLRYVEGMSYNEIATTLSLSLGNVEARIFRGKKKIREKLITRAASPGE
jgi:RNA polymerase sigma-70 factor, ECF subfamily